MLVVLTRRERLESPHGVSIFIVSLARALLELQQEVRIVLGWLESRAAHERLLFFAQQSLALSPVRQLQRPPLKIRLSTSARRQTGLSRAPGNGKRRTS
ncbi:MAG: hypothetical protein QOH05_480 [Acetobacteraceae bacterium]|jgi:hypothetical protein|nr:hypothetical protein [Acetobacteraceae bacterium]